MARVRIQDLSEKIKCKKDVSNFLKDGGYCSSDVTIRRRYYTPELFIMLKVSHATFKKMRKFTPRQAEIVCSHIISCLI